MNQKIELILTGGLPVVTTGNTNVTAAGVVDLYGTEPIQLNISCADIKDIKKKKTTFSQSFVVPGTANNNELFNYIFEIGSDSQFDPRKKTPCQLLVDTIPVITTGTLQLTGIVVDDDKNISYEISIFDEGGDLIDVLASKELDVLDFSELDHLWVYSAITATWSGTSQPYFYPLIDYGYDLNLVGMKTNGVSIAQMYPAIQAKTIWDKIFEDAGYQYTSSFIDSDYFKGLYHPFNGNSGIVLTPEFIDSLKFYAQISGDTTFSNVIPDFSPPPQLSSIAFTNPSFPSDDQLAFTNDSSYPGFDNSNLYDPLTFKYTSPLISNQYLSFRLIFSLSTNTGSSFNLNSKIFENIQANFYRSGYMGGTTAFHKDNPSATNPIISSPLSATKIYAQQFTTPLLDDPSGKYQLMQSGETFWVKLTYDIVFLSTFASGLTVSFNIYDVNPNNPNDFTGFYNNPQNNLVPGTLIPYNSLIPKKIKQIDYINSIMTMHNLYVITDQDNAKNLLIEPRDEYYDAGATKDWSAKLDLSKSVKEQLLSEQQNNRIVFTYKNDADYYNINYTTATNKVFGVEYVYMNNDFTKDDKTIDVIFSPTPSVPVVNSGNYPVQLGVTGNTANDFVIPNLHKPEANNNYGKTDFNLRIVQKNINNLLPLNTGEDWLLDGHNQTSYPYLGMLNHPFSGDTDISFGTVEYEYYALPQITSNNLVNRFYRKYLDQIIDKDGKLITASFYLTPADIQQFKFNDIIFVDGLSNGSMGDYFLVNSIKYTPTTNGVSEVELIQVPNKQVDVIYTPMKSLKASPRQVINLAGASVDGVVSLGIGTVNINSGNWGMFALGQDITIFGGGQSGIVVGSATTIGTALYNGIIVGDKNIVGDSNTNTFILGNNNEIISGLTNVTIFGNNITGTSANTLYVNNIELSSGSTINGIPISAFTSGFTSSADTYWISGSTGTSSIKANNGTAIDATGNYALAEGSGTLASGFYSHAEGNNTIAGGNASHAEGQTTFALGIDGSHAEGTVTWATGATSHAEGALTTAGGDFSHAEGQATTASGNTSHAEGVSTLARGDFSHAEGSATIAGFIAHAEGAGTVASGDVSHAEGAGTTALGINSHAEGDTSVAIGNHSHAEGGGTSAIGQDTHAEGQSTIASGITAHAEGSSTTAIGIASHAEGNQTTASGTDSHSEGFFTTAIGFTSHAEGGGSIAQGDFSHAEGENTLARGEASHSEGEATSALGIGSHAGGGSSIASGTTSFVHGSNSQALGTSTIVFGDNITGVSGNTVYVPRLNLGIVGTGSVVSLLGRDANGFVVSASTSITGGTYTPTLTNVTNVTSSTAANCQYNRVGNMVSVFGSLAITTTLAVATEVDISLPIASNIGSANDINGTGQATSAIATNVYIDGDSTNDRARMKFIGLSVAGAGNIFFSFAYTII